MDESENAALVAATWWTRGKAAIVDILIFLAVGLAPGAVFFAGFVVAWDERRPGVPEGFSFDSSAVLLIVIGGVLILGWLIWGGWLFGYRQGVTGLTPGKRRLGIHLVDGDSGLVPGGAKGVGRWLIPGIVGGIQGIGSALQLIDILWPLWDAKNQRLIDKVFKTRVLVGSPAVVDDGPPLPESPIS
ncbi:MAG: RDD family protein [Actinomycetota bacterium]|nr:RDD family protein [Actinomycetota bacterium]MEE3205416.1 RDD family protein [Actinomycetota bacterium]